MNAAAKQLSQDDITRLMEDPSASAQMDVVSKLSAHYNADSAAGMTGQEAGLAEDIFKLLLSRAEVQVRALIAMNLKESNKLPPEIAEQMASDVREVSLPVLQSCTILSDQYLLGIICTPPGDQEKFLAIARRETVPEHISEALVETKMEEVVTTLVRNEGARIAETTFGKIVENHAQSAAVMESMLERGNVPVAVVERLVERVSETMKASLEEKYGNLVDLTELRKAFDKSLELTSLKLIGLKTTDAQLSRLIKYLNDKGQLSPFSALCMANFQLFEVSLARLLRIPLKNIEKLLEDPRGLRALYEKAGLPDSMYDAVELCIGAIRELEAEAMAKDGGKPVLSPFQLMDRMRSMAAGREIEGLDYMVGMMQHHTRENIKYQAGGG